MKKSLLLHICCAPCAACVVEALVEKFNITFFWYNPNIAPDKEYQARLESAKKYTAEFSSNFVELHENWEASQKQCDYCYSARIKKTINYTVANSFDFFSTTLLAGLYQNHSYIKNACENPKFYYIDGRPNYYNGKNGLKLKGYHVQKYCGCMPSKLEAAREKGKK
ncbi:MAG: epoxyqueuosine reductase QueH [Elusimicrobia bacterium]|nr:epoxyqueuosine reductase QueH [Elusimicrobiota bacterium]